MQFTICESVKEIKDSVKVFYATGDVGKRAYLANITVQAYDNTVTFTGTTGTRLFFAAEVRRPGKCSIFGEDLLNALKTIENAPAFDFGDDDDHTVVMSESDGFSRKIGSWSDGHVGDNAGIFDNAVKLVFNGDVFSEAVKAVQYAASDDEAKYVMNGINFDFSGITPEDMDDSKIYAIATDGRRLAWSEAGAIPVGVSGIIPQDNVTVKSAVADFVAARASKTDPITFSVAAKVEKAKYGEIVTRYCTVDFGRFHIVGAEINRDFPDWKRVIPSASVMNSEFTLSPDFVKESDRIAKTVNNKYKKIIVAVNGEVVTLDSEIAKQVLKSATSVSGFSIFGKFAINVNYLREAVKAAGKTSVRFQMSQQGRPILATFNNGVAGAVIMPMNLEN